MVRGHKQRLMDSLTLPSTALGGGVRGYDGLTEELLQLITAEVDTIAGVGQSVAYRRALVPQLIAVRRLAEQALVGGCPAAPMRAGAPYSPSAWVKWIKEVRWAEQEAYTEDETRQLGISEELRLRHRRRITALLEDEGGSSKKFWEEMYPKAFAEVMGSVP